MADITPQLHYREVLQAGILLLLEHESMRNLHQDARAVHSALT
jgi:hypothetical protein